MARRRNGTSGAWTTKTQHGPLWKYFHPAKYLRSEYRKARRAMRPDRVFLRGSSLDQLAKLRHTQTKQVNEQSRRTDLARATKAAARKAPAKRTAAKRTDPYAVALGIPAQNRELAARQAKAAQPAKKTAGGRTRKTTATTVVPVRNPDGTFNGSQAVPTFDAAAQDANRRAWTGQVDPALLPRSARTRRQRPAGY
jgi:hypothetical protein